MPNLFTPRFPSGSTTQYHYVEKFEWETVQARTVVDFGVSDKKGRKVAMSRHIKFERVILEEGAHKEGNGRIWAVGKPLEFFTGVAHQLRNGDIFGSAYVEVHGATEAECAAELDKRIERARRLAVKKHGGKAD